MKSLRISVSPWFFLLFSICGSVFGSEAVVQFERANQIYRAGDYQKAAKMYEEILKQGFESAELYYNLGNSFYRLNNIPAAIVEYERALRAAPNDEDIAHNLALANLRVTDRIESLPELFFFRWWHSFSDLNSADRWGWIAIITFWISLFSAAILFFSRRFFIRRIFALSAIFLFFVSLISLSCMIQRTRIEQNKNLAIIFSPSVRAKSAPDEQSTDLFVIHEGVKVQLLDSVGGWKKIRLADGKIGWIPSQTYETI